MIKWDWVPHTFHAGVSTTSQNPIFFSKLKAEGSIINHQSGESLVQLLQLRVEKQFFLKKIKTHHHLY